MSARKKILIIGEPGSGKLSLVKALCGSLPPDLPPLPPTLSTSKEQRPFDCESGKQRIDEEDEKGDAPDAQVEDSEWVSSGQHVASHGGLTHEMHISTPYYSTHVGLWIDSFTYPTVSDFVALYTGAEASEVRDVLTCIIVTFSGVVARYVGVESDSGTKGDCGDGFSRDGEEVVERVAQVLRQVRCIKDACASDVLCLAVFKARPNEQGTTTTTITGPSSESRTGTSRQMNREDESYDDEIDDALEEVCMDHAFEYINTYHTTDTRDAKSTRGTQGTNVDHNGLGDVDARFFGHEKRGYERVIEALETCDWSESVEDPSEAELVHGYLMEDEDLTRHLLNLDLDQELNPDLVVSPTKGEAEAAAAAPPEPGSGSVDSVETMEKLVQRIMCAREHLQDLSPAEKRVQAAKLVAEIMNLK